MDNDGRPEIIQANGFAKGETDKWADLHALGTSNDQLIHNPQFWPRFVEGDDLSGDDRNAFYVWNGQRYVNCADSGLGELSLRNTRGIAIADINGDGSQDFVFANQFQPSQLFINKSAQDNHSLILRIVRSVDSNTSTQVLPGNHETRGKLMPVFDVQATSTLSDGKVLIGETDGGSGHSGKCAPAIHFGLGDSKDQVNVRLRWRQNGKQHEFDCKLEPGIYTVVLPFKKES